MAGTNEQPLVNPNLPPGSPKVGPEAGRPVTKVTPDATVYEPESLKKARQMPGITDAEARRRQRQDKGSPVW